LLSTGLGLAYAVVIAVSSMLIDHAHSGAGRVLLIAAPLAAVYPLQEMLLSLSQGESRIALLSVATVLPRLLLVIVLAIALSTALTVEVAVLLTLLCIAVSVTAGVLVLRPAFSQLRSGVSRIAKEVREFGRDIFAGRLVDGLTVGLDKLLLSYFHGMNAVAYYSIALTMSMPVGIGSKALSQSAYKRFTDEPRIPAAILLASLGWSLSLALVIALGGVYLVPLFFTDAYLPSLAVLPLLAAGAALMGANHPFHAWLAARRHGREIRIMSITTSGINVLLNLVLIPLIGMTGAALAFISTYAVNIGMNIFFYRKVRGAVAGSMN
jgi:O-antigen/teichoic acid export membrane protein